MAIKKGLNYWSLPGGLEGGVAPTDALRMAKECGYDGIEVALFQSGGIPFECGDTELAAIRAEAERLGVDIPSVTTGALWEDRLSSDSAQERARAVELVERCIEVAARLGADTVLVIPGAVDVFADPGAPVVSYDVVLERVAEALRALGPKARAAEVNIALENVWNRAFLSPVEMRDFVDSFENPFIGVYLDVANVLSTGYPEQWIHILGHRVKKVHFKDYRRAVGTIEGFVDLLEGDVDWPAVMGALRATGYDDFVTAELIPTYHFAPEVRLANASRAMDAILKL